MKKLYLLIAAVSLITLAACSSKETKTEEDTDLSSELIDTIPDPRNARDIDNLIESYANYVNGAAEVADSAAVGNEEAMHEYAVDMENAHRYSVKLFQFEDSMMTAEQVSRRDSVTAKVCRVAI